MSQAYNAWKKAILQQCKNKGSKAHVKYTVEGVKFSSNEVL